MGRDCATCRLKREQAEEAKTRVVQVKKPKPIFRVGIPSDELKISYTPPDQQIKLPRTADQPKPQRPRFSNYANPNHSSPTRYEYIPDKLDTKPERSFSFHRRSTSSEITRNPHTINRTVGKYSFPSYSSFRENYSSLRDLKEADVNVMLKRQNSFDYAMGSRIPLASYHLKSNKSTRQVRSALNSSEVSPTLRQKLLDNSHLFPSKLPQPNVTGNSSSRSSSRCSIRSLQTPSPLTQSAKLYRSQSSLDWVSHSNQLPKEYFDLPFSPARRRSRKPLPLDELQDGNFGHSSLFDYPLVRSSSPCSACHNDDLSLLEDCSDIASAQNQNWLRSLCDSPAKETENAINVDPLEVLLPVDNLADCFIASCVSLPDDCPSDCFEATCVKLPDEVNNECFVATSTPLPNIIVSEAFEATCEPLPADTQTECFIASCIELPTSTIEECFEASCCPLPNENPSECFLASCLPLPEDKKHDCFVACSYPLPDDLPSECFVASCFFLPDDSPVECFIASCTSLPVENPVDCFEASCIRLPDENISECFIASCCALPDDSNEECFTASCIKLPDDENHECFVPSCVELPTSSPLECFEASCFPLPEEASSECFYASCCPLPNESPSDCFLASCLSLPEDRQSECFIASSYPLPEDKQNECFIASSYPLPEDKQNECFIASSYPLPEDKQSECFIASSYPLPEDKQNECFIASSYPLPAEKQSDCFIASSRPLPAENQGECFIASSCPLPAEKQNDCFIASSCPLPNDDLSDCFIASCSALPANNPIECFLASCTPLPYEKEEECLLASCLQLPEEISSECFTTSCYPLPSDIKQDCFIASCSPLPDVSESDEPSLLPASEISQIDNSIRPISQQGPGSPDQDFLEPISDLPSSNLTADLSELQDKNDDQTCRKTNTPISLLNNDKCNSKLIPGITTKSHPKIKTLSFKSLHENAAISEEVITTLQKSVAERQTNLEAKKLPSLKPMVQVIMTLISLHFCIFIISIALSGDVSIEQFSQWFKEITRDYLITL